MRSKILKQKAISMRKEGWSIPQISKKLGIAKSTASLWVSKIPLPQNILDQIKDKELIGREKGLAVMKARRYLAQLQIQDGADKFIKKLKLLNKKNILKLLVAVLFWCEGSKRTSEVRFTNSDPKLVRVFLYTIRKAFNINELKFRALVHLHEYHNKKRQHHFWSTVTGIPLNQFTKPYLKPHTGKRKRDNYQGCISIRYADANIAKELKALYYSLAEQIFEGA
ncbi:MAG: helix-turn-helix domain-containing protein [Patescibacteria group bacterium]